MPTPPKALASMDKNMTDAERAAREQAEAEVLPERDEIRLVPPPLMTGDGRAKKYWTNIIDRMAGYVILDDLDSDTLGIYCSMLSRYEALTKDLQTVRKNLKKATDDADELETLLGKLDGINSKLQRLESNILQYADKLGLTPSGRVRLAQKRAEKLAAQVDPDGDLFGD